MITLYGIANCDTVKRARKHLELAGLDFKFHDFRRDGLERDRLQDWLTELGDALINRRGTTWRQLSPQEQARAETDPVGLLSENPAMIKRPVFDKNGKLHLGFPAKQAEEIVQWLQQ